MDRVPTAADWRTLSASWKKGLDARIASMIRLRDNLSGCIGCGCLSLKVCPLRNPLDKLGEQGPGPRLLDPW
jgi:MerR family redox-sensitive transcriptional activator SoxR